MTTPRLIRALRRSACHIRYYRYRKKIGNPFPLREALRNLWKRFLFEAFGIGTGI